MQPSFSCSLLPGLGAPSISSFLVLLILANASPAVANNVVSLHVRADPGARACPDQEALEAEVSARLGYIPFEPIAPRRIEVRITEHEGALEAEVRVRQPNSPDGLRALGPDDLGCERLAQDILLTLTLAIDPVAAHAAAAAPDPDPDPRPVAEAVSTPESSAPDSVPVASAEAPSLPLALELFVAPQGVLGLSELPSFGLYGGAAVLLDWVAVHLAFRGTIPSDVSTETGHIQTFLLTADLRLCGRVEGLEICEVTSLGGFFASADGLPDATTASGTHLGIGGRVGYTWQPVPGFGLRPTIEVLAHPLQQDVVVGEDPVWGTGAVSGAVAIEVLWRP